MKQSMRLLRFADIKQTTNTAPSIVTIGNFDGIHLGHQYILQKVSTFAKAQKAKSTVICFEPQPKEFFMGENAPARITPFRDKMLNFQKAGIDQVLCLSFNQKLATLTPDAFVQKILVDGLHAKHVVIGDDFRFGFQRQGDYQYLKKLGQQYGFDVSSTSSYLQENTRISSSIIRTYLQHGEFDRAFALLGRRYSLSGRIHHGNKNGQKLGFPTINIPMPTKVAVSGVYAVKVHLKHKVCYGVANIGIRPTVCGKMRLLETYIFDFNHDLYGQYVTIEFLKFIRAEKKFTDFDALVTQIQSDKEIAKSWIQKNMIIKG